MVSLKVVVEPKSALVLGSGMDIKNVRTSCEFIAGSVIRGAIAQVILDALGIRKNVGREVLAEPKDETAYETFRSLFLGSDRVRFGYLYPARVEATNAFNVDAFPIPITALTCKPSPGFGPQDKGHAVLDRLLPALRGERLQGRCPQCRERMEQLRGFACRELSGKGKSYTRVTVPKKQFIKVGLNRWTETAEEGILYVIEAILPREKGVDPEERTQALTFIGSWTMNGAQKPAIEDLFRRFFLPDADGYKLRIGSARARGMGEVTLRFREVTPALPSLQERLNDFQPRRSDGSPINSEYIYFSLTARSPILVSSGHGQPTMDLTGEVLSFYFTTLPDSIELIPEATFVERATLSGWSQAWGLPKPVLPAIAAGSVFAFRAKRTAENLGDEKALLEFLRSIEEKGIGERRGEGLGEITVCDPFHVDHDPQKFRNLA